MTQRNQQPLKDFCGLSPDQIANWLYAPFKELEGVCFNTPEDLSSCPVMRYLELMIQEALAEGGAFKATAKGNLPAKLVKQASELRSEFAKSIRDCSISISEYAGSNEDKFNALHYTRLLAEISGVFYRKKGQFHLKKSAQKQYESQGVKSFFIPMLEAAIRQFNWGYFDGWADEVDIQIFAIFMLWRVSQQDCVNQLMEEVETAFPDILLKIREVEDRYCSPEDYLQSITKSRFLTRFLEFWGFIVLEPMPRPESGINRKWTRTALFDQTFNFG